MQDYTYNDMLRMQEEAARRVQEMKKRATIAVDGENEPIKEITAEGNLPDNVKRISYPVEFPTETQAVNPPEKRSSQPFSIFKILSEDSDALLIIAIVFMLSQEKADLPVILAMLYLLL